MKNKEVLSVRRYKAGYEVREELIDGSEFGCEDFAMKSAYTHNGDYIGDSKDAYWLCKKRGILPEKRTLDSNVCSIGFCEKEQKFYGWSHRAIFGFGVGSKCKKGDCGYVPGTVDELYDSMIRPDESGWAWQKPENVEKIANGVRIKHAMCHHTIENEDGSLSGWVEDEPDYQVVEIGRGEWEAKTLEDAKQMAIDFASGVS